MNKLLHTFALTALVFLTSIGANAAETVSITIPQVLSHWKVGCHKELKNGQSTTRYIPENETMANWTQLVNIQFHERNLVKGSDALQAMKQEAVFNQGVFYQMHIEKDNDILFEKVFPTGVHELVHMVMTDQGLHRIAYVKRNGPFENLDRQQWMDYLLKGSPAREETPTAETLSSKERPSTHEGPSVSGVLSSTD